MRIGEAEFNRLPPHLQALFERQPAYSEVEAAFAEFGEREARGGGAKLRSAAQGVCYGAPTGGQDKAVRNDTGTASRFFYSAKASQQDRNEGVPPQLDGKPGNNHPTVKPTGLMQWLVRLVTPPGGTVLDPFSGSGSTGKACALEGFDFLGIEREAGYLAIAEARIAHAMQASEQASDPTPAPPAAVVLPPAPDQPKPRRAKAPPPLPLFATESAG